MSFKSRILTSAIILLASTASAQMGPGGGNGFPFNPLIAPDGTILIARVGDAHEPGTGPMHGDHMELTAVDPSGSVLWTWESGGAIHDLAIVDDFVIAAINEGDTYGRWGGIDDEVTSRVVALTLAAGTVAWELELEEVVRSLETTTDRIYAVSGLPGQQGGTIGRTTGHPGHGSGGGYGNGPGSPANESTLFAIGIDGSLLWTLPLD